MLTRCPDCDTTFRITPEQLKVRQGKVRCGECQHVFNALESLIEETVAVLAAPPVSVPVDGFSSEPESTEPVIVAVPPEPTFVLEPVQEAVAPSIVDAPVDLLEPLLEPRLEPVFEPEPEALPEPVPEPESTTEPLPEQAVEWTIAGDTPLPDPLLHESPDEKSHAGRWLWGLGGASAFLALLLQGAIHFRVELAVVSPSARPLLESICGVAGCTVELPSKAELMTIEASDLQPDADQKSLLKLSATLRNRAPFAQAYPHLELSLTDTENRALVRRVMRPEDYLPHGTAIARGLASGEFVVSVSIDSGNVGASGYRLYLFYP